ASFVAIHGRKLPRLSRKDRREFLVPHALSLDALQAGGQNMSDATQINLRFCDTTCEFIEFAARVCACNLARQFRDILRQDGVGENGETEAVTTRVSGRAVPTLGGPRSSARTGVCAVCPDLLRTGHAAFLVLPGLSSMTLYLQPGLPRGPPETPPSSV